MRNNFWGMIYQDPRGAGKRKHRHKCILCNEIIQDGSNVLMARIGKCKTWCLHKACAKHPRPDGVNYTYGEWLEWLAMAKDVQGNQGGWFKETPEEYLERKYKRSL